MAIGKPAKTSDYNIKVTKARFYDWGIPFDMTVNGIQIYGCVFRQGKKKDGTDYRLVSFPSKKGDSGNYWNHVFFPINENLMDDIEKQIEAVL